MFKKKNNLRFIFRLEKHTSVAREANAPLHNEGPIKDVAYSPEVIINYV